MQEVLVDMFQVRPVYKGIELSLCDFLIHKIQNLNLI